MFPVKIVLDTWKFSMILLYILCDDWPIFMNSALNEQLQQQLEYIIPKPDCHSLWISKMQCRRGGTLEERYAIKFYFKLGKMECFRLLLDHPAWISQTQEGQTKQIHQQTFDYPFFFFGNTGMINKEYYVKVLREFRKRFPQKRPALFTSGQWHFHQDNAPVHNSIFVTDHLTKMGIKTGPHPPYSPDLAPCDFCLFPKLKEKLRGCCYEKIEEIKGAVTKVIDTLTQEDFHVAFQKLLEQYNKCTAAGGDYFEGD